MSWGWNPETLSAGAAVVAMLAALVAGWYAARSFGEMRTQSTATQEQATAALSQLTMESRRQERAQAEAVCAWTTSDKWAKPSQETDTDASPTAQTALTPYDSATDVSEELILLLQNFANAPVYDLRVAVDLGTRAEPKLFYAAHIRLLPPTPAGPVRRGVAPASAENWPRWKERRPQNPHPLTALVFRDAAGTVWSRGINGELSTYDSDLELPREWLGRDGTPVLSVE